jgi:5-methylcytosine-specific restriction endonuclease McrA
MGTGVSRSRRARAARNLSADQWLALQEAWGGCAYCGAEDTALQRDCVMPISRGGRYTLDNIAPACRSCNASKSNDEVTGWMRRKRLDEATFLLRHRQIQDDLALRFSPATVVTDDSPTRPADDSR